MEEKKKDLPVFSRNVAANLLLRGFDMYNVRKNTKNSFSSYIVRLNRS